MRRLARLHAQKECLIAAALAKAVGASYEDHIAVRRDGYRFGEITAIASPTLVPDETAVDCQQLEE
jgi:hypothetical protein